MTPTAIVYTSKTGFTKQYAHLLGEALGLPVFSLGDGEPADGSAIVYLGWVHASHVKGYSAAQKRYQICAVCAVGLCDTGTLVEQVRKATAIPAEIPLFTLQGGFDRSRLKGLDKMMISMLVKGLSGQKQRSAQDERMLTLLQQDASYVSRENLAAVVDWYEELS